MKDDLRIFYCLDDERLRDFESNDFIPFCFRFDGDLELGEDEELQPRVLGTFTLRKSGRTEYLTILFLLWVSFCKK